MPVIVSVGVGVDSMYSTSTRCSSHHSVRSSEVGVATAPVFDGFKAGKRYFWVRLISTASLESRIVDNVPKVSVYYLRGNLGGVTVGYEQCVDVDRGSCEGRFLFC